MIIIKYIASLIHNHTLCLHISLVYSVEQSAVKATTQHIYITRHTYTTKKDRHSCCKCLSLAKLAMTYSPTFAVPSA